MPQTRCQTGATTLKPSAARRAVYALSADPVTYGHLNIVERAAGLFDEVLVAIGRNPDKQYLFPLDDRLHMTRFALRHLPNVRVESFSGLLIDFAYEQCASVIVKGVRDHADFDYEKLLFDVGHSQRPGIDTYLLFADPRLRHISSGAAKALQREHGFVHDYAPLHVKQALEQRLSGQTMVGVTGGIASGKTTLCNRLAEAGKALNREVHHIDMDLLAHRALEELAEPLYKDMRQHIVVEFGPAIVERDVISRKKLGDIVFRDLDRLKQLNRMMLEPILLQLKKMLAGKRGLVLLNSALLVETELCHLCNNHIVLVQTDSDTQHRRLMARRLTRQQIRQRLNAQLTTASKRAGIEQAIAAAGFGKLWHYANPSTDEETAIRELLARLVADTHDVSSGTSV